MVKRKGASVMVSYALIVGVVITAIMIVLRIATPILGSSRDVAQVQQAQDVLTEFESRINEVASFGEGTSVSVSYSLSQGRYQFSPENDTVYYEIDSTANIISKNVYRMIGPVNMSRGNSSIVRLTVDFSDTQIDLRGQSMDVGSGFYDANFRNNGTTSGRTQVEVSLR